VAPGEVEPAHGGIDEKTRGEAARILADVEKHGEAGVRRWAEQLGDLAPGAPLVLGPQRDGGGPRVPQPQ
jgi:hypothetical protein